MTIKRRLFISNIIMILIPVCMSFCIMFVGGGIIFKDSRSQNQRHFFEVKNSLIDMAKELLDNGSVAKPQKILQLKQSLERNGLSLIIYSSGKSIFNLGAHDVQNTDKLLQAIGALNGDGSASIGEESVYGEKLSANGRTYTVLIFSTKSYPDYEKVTPAMGTFGILSSLGMLFIVILTNRFLTGFMFKRIEQPLNTLADGVHQVRDGNLDIKIQHEGEDEFASVYEDFNDMVSRLKESLHLVQKQEENRKELLAGISHDIRSPLTSVRAYSEGLLDGVAQTPESQKKYIKMIKTKAEEIDRMVAKLFLFSKMDLGDYPYDPEFLEVNQEILSLVKAMEDEYRAQGLDLEVLNLAENVGIFVDPVQLSSIFNNILENSLKYKNKEQNHVKIHSEIKGNEVYIFLEDDGPGVPEEALDKLFDVFYRSDPSRNNPNKGSGLGLAITAKAVNRMGGSIHAKKSAAGGLCTVIKLPIQRKGR